MIDIGVSVGVSNGFKICLQVGKIMVVGGKSAQALSIFVFLFIRISSTDTLFSVFEL